MKELERMVKWFAVAEFVIKLLLCFLVMWAAAYCLGRSSVPSQSEGSAMEGRSVGVAAFSGMAEPSFSCEGRAP